MAASRQDLSPAGDRSSGLRAVVGRSPLLFNPASGSGLAWMATSSVMDTFSMDSGSLLHSNVRNMHAVRKGRAIRVCRFLCRGLGKSPGNEQEQEPEVLVRTEVRACKFRERALDGDSSCWKDDAMVHTSARTGCPDRT